MCWLYLILQQAYRCIAGEHRREDLNLLNSLTVAAKAVSSTTLADTLPQCWGKASTKSSYSLSSQTCCKQLYLLLKVTVHSTVTVFCWTHISQVASSTVRLLSLVAPSAGSPGFQLLVRCLF